ncbi:hypothetical protein Tco_0973212 [Tanacetum coccineum]
MDKPIGTTPRTFPYGKSKDKILKDYWKERFSDDEDNMDPLVKTNESEECKDPEECGKMKLTRYLELL